MIMLLLVVLFVIVGDFIDAVPAIIIFMPIITKLTQVGDINPLHMGVVIITTLVFGLITPPYGLSLLVASKYVGVGFGEALVRSLPLYVVFLVTIALHACCSPTWCSGCRRRCCPNRSAASRARPAAGYICPHDFERRSAVNSTADLRLPFAVPSADAEARRRDLRASSSRRASPTSVFRAIYDAFLRYQVLLFPPQDLPPAARSRSRGSSARCRST